MAYRVVVLISGNGSNLQAIINSCHQKCLTIAAVISNQAEAYGIQRAQQANLPCHILQRQDFPDKETYDAALSDLIQTYHVDLIVLAGFMQLLSARFTTQYKNQIINIHPSLLPKYPGLHTHTRVLENKDHEHGCTIHLVNEKMDAGRIIAQAKFTWPMTLDKKIDENWLKSHVQALEHEYYPLVLEWLATQKLHLKGTECWLENMLLPTTGYQFIKNI